MRFDVTLALLLPLAQSVATGHAVSHLSEGGASHTESPDLPQHSATCVLCLMAADINGGGLPVVVPALVVAVMLQAPPCALRFDGWVSLPTLAYLSRAPPHACSY